MLRRSVVFLSFFGDECRPCSVEPQSSAAFDNYMICLRLAADVVRARSCRRFPPTSGRAMLTFMPIHLRGFAQPHPLRLPLSPHRFFLRSRCREVSELFDSQFLVAWHPVPSVSSGFASVRTSAHADVHESTQARAQQADSSPIRVKERQGGLCKSGDNHVHSFERSVLREFGGRTPFPTSPLLCLLVPAGMRASRPGASTM